MGMIGRHHRKPFRQAVLTLCIAWFFYWGNSVYVSATIRDQAEAAELEADRRHDWASASRFAEERKAANQALIRSIGWGFFIPLCLLVAGEAQAGVRRMRGHTGR